MKLKIKKINLFILILFFVGTVHANIEEHKFSDPFSDRSWGSSSQSGGLRNGSDNPNETGETPIGGTPIGNAPWLSLALFGLTYGIYLFGKKRKEATNE